MIFSFDLDASKHIIQLQLLIARVGQNDSLRWWEDDSLTEAGVYLLERLFPFAPYVQGRKLALLAAKNRHDTVFGKETQTLHLFHFGFEGDRVQESLAFDSPELELPDAPIRTIDELKIHLAQLVEAPNPQSKSDRVIADDGKLQIKIPSTKNTIDMANRLAWAYLQGEPENPVYPYIKQN